MKITKPKISVLTPVYNAESFIKETIESVISQTFINYEMLLLDDGSTDKSPQIIRSFSDNRIKYIKSSHNFISTLNIGLDMAQGEYIALIDHDDLMMPYRLQTQYNFMESNPDIIACGGNMHSFGWYSKEMIAPIGHWDIIKEMIVRSPMYNPTGFIRKKVLDFHNFRYKRNYSFAADYKFWADLIQLGPIVNIPQILTLYRTSPKQTSVIYGRESSIGAKKIQLEIVEYLLSLVEKTSPLYGVLDEKLIPALDHLGELSFFSHNVFFAFMYEVIGGLYAEGAIQF